MEETIKIRDNFILKYRDWSMTQKRRIKNMASDHKIHIHDIFSTLKEAKREYIRKHKGIARQIGALKGSLERIQKIMWEQFIGGVFLGVIISILINLFFKYLGI